MALHWGDRSCCGAVAPDPLHQLPPLPLSCLCLREMADSISYSEFQRHFKTLTGTGTASESTIILNWPQNHQLTKLSVMGNLSSIQSLINNSADELLQIQAFQPSGLTCLLPPEMFRGECSVMLQMLMTQGAVPPCSLRIPKASSVRRGKIDIG